MAMKVTKVDVWAGEMPDQAGGLDRVLEALAGAGVSLECVVGRRKAEEPGRGHVYLTPVKGKKAQAAAQSAGLSHTDIPTLRVESANKPGSGHEIMGAIAGAGINVRGISTVALGRTAVAYIGFDSMDDANRAAAAIKAAGKAGGRGKGGKSLKR